MGLDWNWIRTGWAGVGLERAGPGWGWNGPPDGRPAARPRLPLLPCSVSRSRRRAGLSCQLAGEPGRAVFRTGGGASDDGSDVTVAGPGPGLECHGSTSGILTPWIRMIILVYLGIYKYMVVYAVIEFIYLYIQVYANNILSNMVYTSMYCKLRS